MFTCVLLFASIREGDETKDINILLFIVFRSRNHFRTDFPCITENLASCQSAVSNYVDCDVKLFSLFRSRVFLSGWHEIGEFLPSSDEIWEGSKKLFLSLQCSSILQTVDVTVRKMLPVAWCNIIFYTYFFLNNLF